MTPPFAWLFLAGLVAAGRAGSPEDPVDDAPGSRPPDKDRSWYVMPAASYDTDDGVGFGARFEYARLDGEHQPYLWAVAAQTYASLRGYHHHRLHYDRMGLGRRGLLRLQARLAWRQWRNDGYWGIGNTTVRERAWVGRFEAEDPRRKRYRYSLYQPFARLSLRQRAGVDSPVYVYGALNPKYSVVESYRTSLLRLHDPYGAEGGFGVQLLGGVQFDTRQPEPAPKDGVLLELGCRGMPQLDGEAGGFGGVFASARGYLSLGTPRLVLAGRVMSELLVGSVPFYEMVQWGGLEPVQGFGGGQTLRGVRFGRWRAPGKAVAGTELRVRVFELGFRKGTVVGGELAPFVETGAVFLAGEQATGPAVDDRVLHPAFGVGSRLILDETFVGRVDVGLAPDPVQEPAGAVIDSHTLGLYITFDYPF